MTLYELGIDFQTLLLKKVDCAPLSAAIPNGNAQEITKTGLAVGMESPALVN